MDDQRVHRIIAYAAAGLLQRRSATSHWGAVEELHALDPSV